MLEQINLITMKNKSPASGIFLLMADITMESCREAIGWIIDANMAEPEERPEVLTLIINSPGGELHAATALIDIMRGSAIPVQTIGLGQIASAGLLIFMAGKKGMRVLTENTSIMSHRFSAGSGGKSHELFAAHKYFTQVSDRMIQLYKTYTGLPEKTIEKVLLPAEDVYLTAKDALKYGICDLIKDLN